MVRTSYQPSKRSCRQIFDWCRRISTAISTTLIFANRLEMLLNFILNKLKVFAIHLKKPRNSSSVRWATNRSLFSQQNISGSRCFLRVVAISSALLEVWCYSFISKFRGRILVHCTTLKRDARSWKPTIHLQASSIHFQ